MYSETECILRPNLETQADVPEVPSRTFMPVGTPLPKSKEAGLRSQGHETRIQSQSVGIRVLSLSLSLSLSLVKMTSGRLPKTSSS